MLNAGPTVTLSPTTAVVNVGYYAATNLAQVNTNLAAGNIATNVTIFGIAGKLSTNVVALVPKTGQTTLYATGDDGDLEKGVVWPNPRFTTNNIAAAGTNVVTDNLTGLMWTRNAYLPGITKVWTNAIIYCTNMNVGVGTYGYNDWRLPNRNEYQSLISVVTINPALPLGHPFVNVQLGKYWSSTTYAGDTLRAWYVDMALGQVLYNTTKAGGGGSQFYVWPVRGGQ